MSRICVKNLGKTSNEKQLRDLFSARGEVTDVRIVKTKSGKSRQFAFVGFRSDVQAQEAISYYNNTFLDTSRITVESAKKVGDPLLLEGSRSRHTKKKLEKFMKEKNNIVAGKQEPAKKPVEKKKEKEAPSKEFSDFLEVMKNRSNSKKWGNDERLPNIESGNGNAPNQADDDQDKELRKKEELKKAIGSDDDESSGDEEDVNDLTRTRKQQAAAATASGSDDSEDEGYDREESLSAANQSKSKVATKKAAVSDLDYLRSKVRAKFSDEESGGEDGDDDQDEDSDDDDGIRKVAEPKKRKNDTAIRRFKEDDEEDDDDDNVSSAGGSETNNKKTKGEHHDATGTSSHGGDKHARSGDNNSKAVAGGATDSNNRKVSSSEAAEQGPGEGEEEEDARDTGRLFIRNLPFACSEEELRELFEKYGPLSSVHLPLDAEKKGKGFGFVQFVIPEHAVKALDELDGTSFQGRVMHVIFAKKVPEPVDKPDAKKNNKLSAFQQKKEDERRAMAGKKDGWNASYVRSDAVVDALADKYGVNRSDILDTAEGGGEMAVRLAIGESHIIQENRDFFSSHGVDLAALESSSSSSKASARSTTTLLIKNLPHDCVAEELESMFSKFGNVATMLLPKSKAVALVDFIEPTEARSAFKGLAYRKYKHVPLYLEWAPSNVIDKQKAAAAKATQTAEKSAKGLEKEKKDKNNGGGSNSAAVDRDDGQDYSTLFVKNLNFTTDETALKYHINSLGIQGLRAVSIPVKTKGTQSQTMGFGFLEFRSAAFAETALKRLDSSALDGHSLQVKPSDKRLSAKPAKSASSSSGGASTKLIVRNVAFQATKSEISALFATFGSVKRVRIPKKMGGDHRGFAFVDFATTQEAAAAMGALKNAHLYGRHLVLEWAKDEDEDIDALRKRAKVDETAIRSEHKKRRIDDGGGDPIQGAGIGDVL